MSVKSVLTNALTVVTLALFGSVSAPAGEPVKHAGRNFAYLTKVEMTEVDKEKKKAAGNFERVGLTLHTAGPRAGQTSTITITGSFDLTNRLGPHQATIVRRFEDGDTVTIEVKGETKRGENGRFGEGRYRCLEGTGSLRGVRCEGSYLSHYFDNKMGMVDWEGTIKLASQ